MTIEPDPITASTHEGQLKAWFGHSVSNLDAIIKKGQREFQDSQEDWAEFKDYEKRNMAFRAGFEMAMKVVTESANGKLTDLGYRWNGTAWTDEPTAEQRLEAVRQVLDNDDLQGDDQQRALNDILAPTWRPGKTEGK
jgi:hypothetical protein